MAQKPESAPSLRRYLTAVVVVVTVLVLGIQGIYHFVSERQLILERMHAQVDTSLKRLSMALAPFIDAYAPYDYDKLVINEIASDDYLAIIVRDRNMGAIVGQNLYVSGRLRTPDGDIVAFGQANPDHLQAIANSAFSDTRPILSRDGKELGSVTIHTTNRTIQQARDKALRETLVTSLATALSLVLLLSLLLRKLVARPLADIVKALQERDADGIPTSLLPASKYREIGLLHQTMNQMMEAIRRSHEAVGLERSRLQNVIEGTNVGVWEWNVRTGETHFNERWANIVGCTLEELQPVSIETWLDLAHPDDLATSKKLLQQHFSGELPYYECEVRMRHKDGHWVWVLNRGKVSSWTGDGLPLLMSGTHQDITGQKQQSLRLEESESRFRGFFEQNSSVMLMIVPGSGEIVGANPAAEAYYGFPPGQLVGRNIAEINQMAPSEVKRAHELASSGQQRYFQFKHSLANGEVRDVEVHSTPIRVNDQSLLFSIVHDISDRVIAEQQLELAASVFTHAREGILITDEHARIIDVNDAFTRYTGYEREEILGENPRLLSSGVQDKGFYQAMWQDLSQNGFWQGELWNRKKNGELFAEIMTISAIRDGDNNVRHYVALFSDITALKQNEQKLEQLAHYDALTGLPNRLLLSDRLRHAMRQDARREQSVAVVFLDLDGFKQVNDEHGHDTGDQLLILLAKRMKQALRETDTLARLGGDEFVAVLGDLNDTDQCLPLLSRLIEAVSQTTRLSGGDVMITASLGVTFYPQTDDVDADQLLRQADQAMYQAKLAGKNRFHIFDADRDRDQRGRHEKLERIQSALQEEEFTLYYQPKVNMRSGELVGAEALVRWQHPDRGLLPPSEFLPTIEGHTLMAELGEWTLQTALQQLAEWQETGLHASVSVNIAASHLQLNDFAPRLRSILASHPEVSPHKLQLEILETSALQNMTHVSQVISDCGRLGVSFALDDFGTGYSSLTYLKRLPAEVLKIDKSFVRDMHDDPDDLTILEGVISLAEAFHREVIAEGVESVEHGELLLWLGCEQGQGFAIGKPMPAGMLTDWLAKWQPPKSWVEAKPIEHGKLPIVFAMVQHRAWVVALEQRLAGEPHARLSLDTGQCPFGHWLNNEGARHLQEDTLSLLKSQHEKMHRIAAELVAADPPGEQDKQASQLTELYQLHQVLLDELHRQLKA